MQKLLKCEINEKTKQLRNRWNFDFDCENLAILSNLVLILKLYINFFWKNSRTNLYIIKKISTRFLINKKNKKKNNKKNNNNKKNKNENHSINRIAFLYWTKFNKKVKT